MGRRCLRKLESCDQQTGEAQINKFILRTSSMLGPNYCGFLRRMIRPYEIQGTDSVSGRIPGQQWTLNMSRRVCCALQRHIINSRCVMNEYIQRPGRVEHRDDMPLI